jgi:ERCC4-type nuclease
MILHSPTERGEVIRRLTALGSEPRKKAERVPVACSGAPEGMGVDFAWLTEHENEWRGVQRKELSDFLASLDDGRLAKEIAQMNAHVLMPTLVLEGRLQVANGNVMTGSFKNDIPYASFMKRLITIADRGVQVFFTSEASQTAEFIFGYYQWSLSVDHSTAQHRPKPTNDWGKPTNRDWQVHLLQGLDGVGAKTANAILDTLGRCPLRVDATVAELMQVPGVGRATARKIIYSINGTVE